MPFLGHRTFDTFFDFFSKKKERECHCVGTALSLPHLLCRRRQPSADLVLFFYNTFLVFFFTFCFLLRLSWQRETSQVGSGAASEVYKQQTRRCHVKKGGCHRVRVRYDLDHRLICDFACDYACVGLIRSLDFANF